MLLAPHARSTLGDLLRLVAVWLALVVLVQGIAAAFALGAGPQHRHRDSPASAAPATHHHDHVERHHHAAFDASVLQAAADADFDAAGYAVTAALALMAAASLRRLPDGRRHVMRAGLPWHFRSALPDLLLKPPRRA